MRRTALSGRLIVSGCSRLLPHLFDLEEVRYQAEHPLGLEEEHEPGLAAVDAHLVAVPQEKARHHAAQLPELAVGEGVHPQVWEPGVLLRHLPILLPVLLVVLLAFVLPVAASGPATAIAPFAFPRGHLEGLPLPLPWLGSSLCWELPLFPSRERVSMGCSASLRS